jgi:hypothetical protein
MLSRTPLLCLAVAAVALIAAGSASHAEPPVAPAAARPPTSVAESQLASVVPVRAPRVDSDPSTYSACAAPSVLKLHGLDDARDLASLATCAPGDPWSRLADREQAAALHCDVAGRPVDLARVLEGALPLDPATAAHVHALYRAGQAQGRRGDAFGLVGDSLTVDANFLRPFAPGAGHVVLPPEVQAALPLGRFSATSFTAPRAAKVGVRATWPLTPRGFNRPSPLEEMVDAESPAYAVVLYGANDALWRTDSIELLVRGFDTALTAIVDALEARGIIPILTTVPKHGRERGWPDCAATPTSGGNERFAVQAAVLSADVAELACRRHLPLVDLRWALEPLLDHGVGPDGVHLSVHPGGGGVLDASGLECGYNVRNLVTLRELGRVVDAAAW